MLSLQSRMLEIRKSLRRFGVEVSRYPPPNSLERQLKRVIVECKIELIVDVGAHQGEFVQRLRQDVRYEGAVVSFEPMRANFEVLLSRYGGDPAWRGHNLALGTEACVLPLQTFDDTRFNSLMTANDFGRGQFHLMRERDVEMVEVARLDAKLHLTGPTILKIDAQGYDLQVLEGTGAELRRVAAVVLEVPVRPIYDEVPGITTIIEQLESLGFDLAGLYPLQPDSTSVIEFDGIFTRNPSG